MVAFLLYGIGLLYSVGTVILAIINGPGALSALLRGLTADNADYWGAFVAFGRSFSWAVVPFIGGLLLMGFAQIVMAFRRRS